LKRISFLGCIKFTEEGILSLISKCPSYMTDFRCDKDKKTKTVVDELNKKFIKTKKK
jgi:hypothetical protein